MGRGNPEWEEDWLRRQRERREAPSTPRAVCAVCGRDGVAVQGDGRLWPHKGMSLPLTDCDGQEAA